MPKHSIPIALYGALQPHWKSLSNHLMSDSMSDSISAILQNPNHYYEFLAQNGGSTNAAAMLLQKESSLPILSSEIPDPGMVEPSGEEIAAALETIWALIY